MPAGPHVKLVENYKEDMSNHIKACGLTQEAPYVKEYVKGLTYRLTQGQVDVLMRVDGRGREGNTDYFFNPPQADGVDGEVRVEGKVRVDGDVRVGEKSANL